MIPSLIKGKPSTTQGSAIPNCWERSRSPSRGILGQGRQLAQQVIREVREYRAAGSENPAAGRKNQGVSLAVSRGVKRRRSQPPKIVVAREELSTAVGSLLAKTERELSEWKETYRNKSDDLNGQGIEDEDTCSDVEMSDAQSNSSSAAKGDINPQATRLLEAKMKRRRKGKRNNSDVHDTTTDSALDLRSMIRIALRDYHH